MWGMISTSYKETNEVIADEEAECSLGSGAGGINEYWLCLQR
jgi:hypothetical protein